MSDLIQHEIEHDELGITKRLDDVEKKVKEAKSKADSAVSGSGAPLQVSVGGSPVGEAEMLNIVSGSNVSIVGTREKSGTVKVTVSSTGGGGGSGITTPVEVVTSSTIPTASDRLLGWLIWVSDEAILKVNDFINSAYTWREVGGASGSNKYGSAKYGSAKYT